MALQRIVTDLAELSGELAQAKVTGLPAALTGKADASNTVRLTGAAQTIDASTTFTATAVFTRVGIGGSPSNNLHVFHGNNGNGGVWAEDVAGHRVGMSGSNGSNGLPFVGSISNHAFTLGSSNAERMRILSTGQIVVGASSLGSAAAQFEARAKDASTPIAAFYASDGSNPFLVGPVGKLTLPGRDGPITANADAATITLNLGTSDFHTVTLGGNRTLAITGASTGQRFTVKLIQSGAGSWNPTWWSVITWFTADGIKPTPSPATGKATYLQFVCTGSGTYDGFLVAGQA